MRCAKPNQAISSADLNISTTCDLFSDMKWKCDFCSKVLSSKQNAIKHTNNVHKDPNINVSKVISEVKADSEKNKNNVNSYFSSLSNIFSDSRLVEDFSWGKSAQSRTCSEPESEKQLPDYNTNTNTEDCDHSAATGPKTCSPFVPPFKNAILNSHQEVINSELPCSLSQGEIESLDTVINSSIEVVDNQLDAEAYPLSPLPIEAHSHAIGPSLTSGSGFKRRGHCGSSSCVGCSRPPCGSCYNCLHKRKVR